MKLSIKDITTVVPTIYNNVRVSMPLVNNWLISYDHEGLF